MTILAVIAVISALTLAKSSLNDNYKDYRPGALRTVYETPECENQYNEKTYDVVIDTVYAYSSIT
jgi:hypothetical protein